MKEKGLTLMELLIVIGIILTLASLVLGVVHLGLNVAQKVQCINNLRQIYTATKLYEEEYGSPPLRAKQFVSWNPNLKQVVICPKDPYQGCGDIIRYGNCSKALKEHPDFVPFSYEPIYWTWYWMLKTKPHFRASSDEEKEWWEKDWQETIIAIQRRMNKPDMPVVFCPFHNLAIFRDGNIGRTPPPIIIGSTSPSD